MAKRKRTEDETASQAPNGKLPRLNDTPAESRKPPTVHVQIITGSYERTLHGIQASVPQQLLHAPRDGQLHDGTSTVSFSDTFLFNAHASSIRCLAISAPSMSSDWKPQKLLLATGGADERINLYHLSASPAPAPRIANAATPSLAANKISQNPRNRELGSLLHHSGPITALYFHTRTKLLSSSSDNTISASRTRDWAVLTTIKPPIPKPVGRPSGDTLAPGEVPAGVNDFAIHPTGRLLVSVGRGEKCMRLWNLMTGRKAGVLSFDKEMLAQVGERRHSRGEGRRVLWDLTGEEFAVGFERGAVVFGMDCKAKGIILPEPRAKVQQMHYLHGAEKNVLCVSTDDGRVLFYALRQPSCSSGENGDPNTNGNGTKEMRPIRSCELLGQLGGVAVGLTSRVKDFAIVQTANFADTYLFVTGSSDGAARLWRVNASEVLSTHPAAAEGTLEAPKIKQIGTLLGTCETGNRITCLQAFLMGGEPEDGKDAEPADEEESSSSDSEEEQSG